MRKVVRNSGYLFIGNALSMVVQSVLTARLLGVLGFGIIGTVISFASNINRLLSFRMGELVGKYVAQYLAEEKKDLAAAALKAAALTETLTSLVAYLLLVLSAPLAARYILKDPATAPLIAIYGLALLANFVTETSTGFLQVSGHFRSQGVINFAQSVVTAGVIVYAYIIKGDIWLVMGAYLLGKSINGLALAGLAARWARQIFGPGWLLTSMKSLPERRKFWGFAVSTNLSGTITMLTRDNEEVWISLILSPLQTGYYKAAKALMNLVMLPITPFIGATYPELTRAVAEKAWARLRNLLSRLTMISAAWTGAVVVGLLVLGRWLITIYGPDFAPAYPAVLILLVGYGLANILYWNRNLLLSLHQPNYPLKVITVLGAFKVVLTFLLVPLFGYLVEAALLSAFQAISVTLLARRGLREVRTQEALALKPS
ncbi:MAG: oligosaccharide flippase family protein [Chloroflexota bacterium]